MDEQFDDDSCERYVADLKPDEVEASLDALLWKLEGLRLLDSHDSDEGELETAEMRDDDYCADYSTDERARPEKPAPLSEVPTQTVHPPKPAMARVDGGLVGMQALLERRKRELEASRKPRKNHSAMDMHASQEAARYNTAADCAPPSLTTPGLRSFLGLQCAHIADADRTSVHVPREPHTKLGQAAIVQEPQEPQEPQCMCPARNLPSPTLSSTTQAMSAIVSSSVLASHQLVRYVQAHLPNLDFIERDSVVPPARSGTSNMTKEADLSLSPSTGLICTTVQKLKQRPLPGQGNFFGVRERIAATSSRYERCIVLISDGRPHNQVPVSALDERDATAVNDFIGFANGLKSSVEVCYIPGGDAELSKWIAASIIRHCCAENAILLHDETVWERVLRSAGANSIAAQRILANLKRAEAVETNESSSDYGASSSVTYGLSAFVQMTAEERVQRFGPFMGGEGVLAGVSEVVDRGWTSASVQ